MDVLFLDVSMPEVNGIQFAEALQRLKNPPAVIFVTAYSEHALEGFKVNARRLFGEAGRKPIACSRP